MCTSMISPPIQPQPCDNYFGNLCGGFGAPTTCHWCGWDKASHEPALLEMVRLSNRTDRFDAGRSQMRCEHVFNGHGDREDRCQYCDLRRDQWQAQFGPERAPGAVL